MFFRKKLLLSKIESSYGVDSVPTAGANAIQTRDLAIEVFQGNTADLNYDRPRLGASKYLHTGPHTRYTFKTDVVSSGTPGTPPPVGVLLRGCGMQEKNNGTAVTGTAQAGGASSITLAAGASAVDDAYNYFSIRITSGTGSGQKRTISDYNGTTKVATVSKAWTTPPDNTSVYSIDAQSVYVPISASFESLSNYVFLDGIRHNILGGRGSVQLGLNHEGLPEFTFNFIGLRVAPSAVPNPTPVLTAWREPLPVNKANTPSLSVHGYAALAESLSIDLANNVVYRNVVNAENVYITDRNPSLSVGIEMPDFGTKNYDAIIAAHTADRVDVVHGNVAGDIFEAEADLVQLTNPRISDSDGITLLTMDGRVLPTDAGDDEVIFRFK